jgi:hypothetical protein
MFHGKPFTRPAAGLYVMENVLFKISFRRIPCPDRRRMPSSFILK